MNQQTSISDLQSQQIARENVANLPIVSAGFDSLQGFELMQRGAKLLASSDLVPQHYRGNIANCVIALNMASRIGADPLMVMQNLYMVHGNPGWSAQFLIASFNQNPAFSALRYDFFGAKNTDEWGCRAWAIERETGAKLVGADVTIALSKAEGWYGKNGSKWKTMPQQMLMYRAASWFIRAYAPEIAMGLQSTDELRDVYDAQRDSNGIYSVNDIQSGAHVEAQTVDSNRTDDDGRAEPTVDTKKPDPVSQESDDSWPKSFVDADTGEILWEDSAGTMFDPAIHGWSGENKAPSVTPSGKFRKKRSASADPDPVADRPGGDGPPNPGTQTSKGGDGGGFDDIE